VFEKASYGVRGQTVRITYTNIILMKIWNLLALGQVYNNASLLEQGRTLFNTWLGYVARYGNREYDSPTYSGVDIESLLLMIRFSNDPDIRTKARTVLEFFMNDLSAHYNPLGGYLAGAHSRAYNRVFPRDLLEEKYMNPLLGRKNNNIQLFHQLVSATLNDIGLSAYQQELMNRPGRYIMQRWDLPSNAYSSHYVGRKFSIASSNQNYSPDDKAFAVYLSSKRIPEMLNITYVMEGRDDHYGTWAVEGKGEKLKHLMPPNYPPNGGWGKARHLAIFQQVAQHQNEMVFLASGNKDHNCINDYLNSTIILPNAFDEIWLGDKKVSVPSNGASISFDEANTFIARFEDVAVAIRILWSDAAEGARMSLYNDGFVYQPNREKFSITNNKGLRLTLRHANNGKGAIAMWWKVSEGLKSDADFRRFRKEVLEAPVTATVTDGIIDVSVKTIAGKLGVKADPGSRRRLDHYHPKPLPENYLFLVDGVEIGKPIMDKYVQKGVY
jgi:hypothetical protein